MQAIPVTILAGSDPEARPAEGPTSGLHPLHAYKGAELLLRGRPLVAHLAERLAATRGFGPVRIAGPERRLGACPDDYEVVDTDGSLAANLRAVIEHHRRSTPGPLGLIASDVLLSNHELAQLRAQYEQSCPCALWFPLVLKPVDVEQLGASAWKPSYPLHRCSGDDPVRVLPGHLGIFEPDALRLPLLYGLLGAAYGARNHSVRRKRAAMLKSVLAGLIATDVRLLLSLRAPTRTLEVLANGLRVARELHSGTLTLAGLESALTHIVLRRSHRRAHPNSPVALPLTDILSLAKDVDTVEEMSDLAVRLDD